MLFRTRTRLRLETGKNIVLDFFDLLVLRLGEEISADDVDFTLIDRSILLFLFLYI